MSVRARIFATPDVWAAMRLNYETASRRLGVLRVVGRLKPGVTVAAAQAELNAITAEWKQRFPFRNQRRLTAYANVLFRGTRDADSVAVSSIAAATGSRR